MALHPARDRKKPEKMYPYHLKSMQTSAIVSDEHYNVHVAIVQIQGIASVFYGIIEVGYVPTLASQERDD